MGGIRRRGNSGKNRVVAIGCYLSTHRINVSTSSTIDGIIRRVAAVEGGEESARESNTSSTPSLTGFHTQTGLCGFTLLSFTAFAIGSWLAVLAFSKTQLSIQVSNCRHFSGPCSTMSVAVVSARTAGQVVLVRPSPMEMTR
jgi:hypothetical protein